MISFPIQDPLSFLNYGELHVIELGLAIGLLAATFYRSDRYISYTILGLSGGIIALQRLLQAVPQVMETTFLIATKPLLFMVPMVVAFGLGVGCTKLIQSKVPENETTGPDEQLAD